MPASVPSPAVNVRLAKNNANGSSLWVPTNGCNKLQLHIHVDAAGATPTATVKVQATNMIASVAATVAVTPKTLNGGGSGTTVTATGDTFVDVDCNGFLLVRLDISANTNINLECALSG